MIRRFFERFILRVPHLAFIAICMLSIAVALSTLTNAGQLGGQMSTSYPGLLTNITGTSLSTQKVLTGATGTTLISLPAGNASVGDIIHFEGHVISKNSVTQHFQLTIQETGTLTMRCQNLSGSNSLGFIGTQTYCPGNTSDCYQLINGDCVVIVAGTLNPILYDYVFSGGTTTIDVYGASMGMYFLRKQ